MLLWNRRMHVLLAPQIVYTSPQFSRWGSSGLWWTREVGGVAHRVKEEQ
jgi:hypothetical protein